MLITLDLQLLMSSPYVVSPTHTYIDILWSLYEVEEEDPYKQLSTQVEMNILMDLPKT